MKYLQSRPGRYLLILLVVAVAAGVLVVGCSDTGREPTAPDLSSQQLLLRAAHPRMQSAVAVQELYTRKLLADPEIVGTAVGLTDKGEPAVLVLLKSERGRMRIKNSLDGIPVVAMVTGPIRALGKPPKPPKPEKTDHKTRQARPISLGVSGGNAWDLANGYCCSGTLGALVTGGNKLYILSNSHVFAGDIEPPDVAEIGDPINQPGLIDVGCYDIPDDYVAYLSSGSSLTGNTNVDCAKAEIISGTVKTDGTILGIGALSSQTVDAYLDQPVKKAGRTTGVTRSKVNGLNANVEVWYETECAGDYFTVEYTGQILVSSKGDKFLRGGDSGSLMVEDVSENPRAVGLLYAGGGGVAVANPIDDVLSYLNVQMVGN
jgi:hypothetical protein